MSLIMSNCVHLQLSWVYSLSAPFSACNPIPVALAVCLWYYISQQSSSLILFIKLLAMILSLTRSGLLGSPESTCFLIISLTSIHHSPHICPLVTDGLLNRYGVARGICVDVNYSSLWSLHLTFVRVESNCLCKHSTAFISVCETHGW